MAVDSGWRNDLPRRTGNAEHKQRRARVFARDHYTCQLRYPGICTGAAQDLDHIDNTRGPNYETDANTQAACHPCNMHKAKREATAGRRAAAASARHPIERHPGARNH